MTVTSSIVCGTARPSIMSPKPCWRRTAFPDSGKVVTGLGGCAHIRASPRRPACRIARHCHGENTRRTRPDLAARQSALMVVCYLPFGTTWLPSRHRHFAWTPSDQDGRPDCRCQRSSRAGISSRKEGVEVAHMGEAPAGEDYSEQWASPALGSTVVDQVVDIILTTTPNPHDNPDTSGPAGKCVEPPRINVMTTMRPGNCGSTDSYRGWPLRDEPSTRPTKLE
jgi:hypothetical protein